jgi:hypothetical protein
MELVKLRAILEGVTTELNHQLFKAALFAENYQMINSFNILKIIGLIILSGCATR